MAATERGAVGRQTFERVRELVDQGMAKQTAFQQVADESGRSKQTVQTAYYRLARTMPDGGGVRQRPRGVRKSTNGSDTGRRSRRQSGSGSVDVLIADVHRSIDALGAHLRSLENDVRGLRAQGEQIDKIRKMLG
jgi:uncharacterized protein YoaH (UPF0181 family)